MYSSFTTLGQGKLNGNRYFCAVRYLFYICLLLSLFLISSPSGATNIDAPQNQKVACKKYFKTAVHGKTISFSNDGSTQFHPLARPVSSLKRHVGSGNVWNLYLLLQQTQLCPSVFTVQNRRDYIPHSLLHLFPKHNFW